MRRGQRESSIRLRRASSPPAAACSISGNVDHPRNPGGLDLVLKAAPFFVVVVVGFGCWCWCWTKTESGEKRESMKIMVGS